MRSANGEDDEENKGEEDEVDRDGDGRVLVDDDGIEHIGGEEEEVGDDEERGDDEGEDNVEELSQDNAIFTERFLLARLHANERDTHIRRQPHTRQIQRVVLQALHDARRGEELLEARDVLEARGEVAGDGVEEGGEVAGDGVLA